MTSRQLIEKFHAAYRGMLDSFETPGWNQRVRDWASECLGELMYHKPDNIPVVNEFVAFMKSQTPVKFETLDVGSRRTAFSAKPKEDNESQIPSLNGCVVGVNPTFLGYSKPSYRPQPEGNDRPVDPTKWEQIRQSSPRVMVA